MHRLQDVMHVFTAQLAFETACGLPWLRQVVLSNMVTACNNSLGCPVALARPQTRQSFSLAPLQPYCVIGNTSQL